MNMIQILEILGYEVIRYNHDRQVYLVKKIPLRAKREGLKRNPDIKIRVQKIDFDSDGDLYVEFIEDRTGKVCDTYWHNNMSIEQIYDIDFDIVEESKEDDNTQNAHDEWMMSNSSMYRV